MDDHQRPNGIPVTRFTLQSIYAQSDDEKLEFEYESGNTNILVSCTCVLVKCYLHLSYNLKCIHFVFHGALKWVYSSSFLGKILEFRLERICGFNALRFRNEANGMASQDPLCFYLPIKKIF